jgi:hypothetical protein
MPREKSSLGKVRGGKISVTNLFTNETAAAELAINPTMPNNQNRKLVGSIP